MKRRVALVWSAAATATVFGGAVATAALTGNGILGFHAGSASSTPSGAESPADTATSPTTGADDSSDGPKVTIEVIEDRVVVRSGASGAASSADESVGGSVGAWSMSLGAEDPTPPSSVVTTRPPRAQVDDDDDDEYEHHEYEDDDDHDEHEYEHEYEDD